MTDRIHTRDGGAVGAVPDGDTISPLAGEAGIPSVADRPRGSMSKKGLLAVALMMVSLVAVSAISIQRFTASGKKADDGESKRVSDRPSAATTEPRKLEMPPAPTASAVASASPRIPALLATAEDSAEPIGVRRSGQGAQGAGGAKSMLPEDAPVLLVSTRPGALASPSAPMARRSDAAPGQPMSMDAPEHPTDPDDPIAATHAICRAISGNCRVCSTCLPRARPWRLSKRPARRLLGLRSAGSPMVRPRAAPRQAQSRRPAVACSEGSSRARPRPESQPRCWAIAA